MLRHHWGPAARALVIAMPINASAPALTSIVAYGLSDTVAGGWIERATAAAARRR